MTISLNYLKNLFSFLKWTYPRIRRIQTRVPKIAKGRLKAVSISSIKSSSIILGAKVQINLIRLKYNKESAELKIKSKKKKKGGIKLCKNTVDQSHNKEPKLFRLDNFR